MMRKISIDFDTTFFMYSNSNLSILFTIWITSLAILLIVIKKILKIQIQIKEKVPSRFRVFQFVWKLKVGFVCTNYYLDWEKVWYKKKTYLYLQRYEYSRYLPQQNDKNMKYSSMCEYFFKRQSICPFSKQRSHWKYLISKEIKVLRWIEIDVSNSSMTA